MVFFFKEQINIIRILKKMRKVRIPDLSPLGNSWLFIYVTCDSDKFDNNQKQVEHETVLVYDTELIR